MSVMISLQWVNHLLQMSTTVLLSQWNRILRLAQWWSRVFTAETIADSSFHTISCFAFSGDHSDWSQRFDQYAPQSLLPEESVNNCIAELRIHLESRIMEVPDHGGRKLHHHIRSWHASEVTRMWWWSLDTEQLTSINQRKKMRPAGTTLHAKDNLPISDSSSRFVHFFKVQNEWIAINSDAFHSDEILASIMFVLSTMPRKVRHVVGLSTFSVFIGAPLQLHRDNIWDRFWWHTLEFAEPAVKKSSR